MTTSIYIFQANWAESRCSDGQPSPVSQHCPQLWEGSGGKELRADHWGSHVLFLMERPVLACGLQFRNRCSESLIPGLGGAHHPPGLFHRWRPGISRLEKLPGKPYTHSRQGPLLWVNGFPKRLWNLVVPWWLWGYRVKREALITHITHWLLSWDIQQWILNLPCTNGIHTPYWQQWVQTPSNCCEHVQ